jgi:hypothetical protein
MYTDVSRALCWTMLECDSPVDILNLDSVLFMAASKSGVSSFHYCPGIVINGREYQAYAQQLLSPLVDLRHR